MSLIKCSRSENSRWKALALVHAALADRGLLDDFCVDRNHLGSWKNCGLWSTHVPPAPGILTPWSQRWGLRTCIYISFLDNSNMDGINDAGNSETSGIRGKHTGLGDGERGVS